MFGPSRQDLEKYAQLLVTAMDSDQPIGIQLLCFTDEEKAEFRKLKHRRMSQIISHLASAAPECDRSFIQSEGPAFLQEILDRL